MSVAFIILFLTLHMWHVVATDPALLFEGAGVALISAAAYAIGMTWKVTRHLRLVHEAIIGRPASQGVEALPSMVERFKAVNDRLDARDVKDDARNVILQKINREMYPNGGTSLVDKVNRIDARTRSAVTTAADADAIAVLVAQKIRDEIADIRP